MSFRIVEHTGDTAVELSAATEPELIESATRAVASILVDTSRSKPRAEREERVALEAEDGESLLVDYLNELIYLFDARAFLPWETEVEEVDLGSPARLRTVVRGDTFDPGRHTFLTEIKAATFHGVEIRREDGTISTRIVFDL